MLALSCAAPAPPPVAVPPPPPPPTSAPVVEKPAAIVAVPRKTLDFDSAKRVSISAVPLRADAPKPIGDKPGKTMRLKEVARQGTKAADERFTMKNAPYDPRRLNELKDRPPHLPPGSPHPYPIMLEGHLLQSIYESNGKTLLSYEPSLIAIIDGDTVETIVDMDPPNLKLSEDDRAFADIQQSQYKDGILYVCRGYNANLRTRKGYVTALDVATGELRWRSPAQTCGGIVAVFGDYLLTGYGEDIMPYQFKLLRRYDGSIAQSIPNLGAGLDMLVESDTKVVVETFRHIITYELR